MFYKDEFYQKLSEKIDLLDYSSYTVQYPPPFIGKNDFNNDSFLKSFSFLNGGVGIYIHIPFCETKCTFCRYFSIIDNKISSYDKYTTYIIKELFLYKKQINGKVTSLYFGGGTPSILSHENIDKILLYFFSNFNLSSDFQFCFEVNPSSITLEKINVLKKYNCNRLTLGVQSLNPIVLSGINRNQTIKDVLKTFKFAREVGIDYVNVDLMLGIKGQTLKSFIYDLKYILNLKPDVIHLHTYEPTGRVIDNNKFVIENNLKNKMSILGNIIIKKFGYIDLEGDAYGKIEQSKNKQLYDAQLGGKYIGVGVSAVGYNGKIRYINFDNLSKYYELIDKGKFPVKFASNISNKARMVQYIIYNMRYKKIDLIKFKNIFGEDFLSHFSDVYNELNSIGIVEIINNNLCFYLNTTNDFTIFSKYFYEDHILKFYKEKYEI